MHQRISIDAVHAPCAESVTSTLDTALTPSWPDTATPAPSTDDDHRPDRQSAGRAVSAAFCHPTRPGPPRLDHHLSAVSLHADALGWIVHAYNHAALAAPETSFPQVAYDVLVDGSRKVCGILANSPQPRPRRSSSATASTSPKRPGLFPLHRPRPWPEGDEQAGA